MTPSDLPEQGDPTREWERRYVTPVGDGIGVHALNAPLRPDRQGAREQKEVERGTSRYLEFVRVQPPERKTPIVVVRSKSSDTDLGTIAWFGRWRQFCFYPAARTIFNVGCMTDIQAKIAELQEERRATRTAEPYEQP